MEHIEHPERHNQAMRTVEQSIGRLELNQLIMFTPHEVQLYERLKKEHPQQRSQFVLIDEAPSVTSLIFPQRTDVFALIEPAHSAIRETFRSQLMESQALVDAAAQIMAVRDYNELERTIPCPGCYQLPEPQAHCYFCTGIGSVQRYPRVRLSSQVNKKYTDITLDIPMLLSRGKVKPEWDLQTSYIGKKATTIGSLGIALTPLFDSVAKRLLDVDTENTAVVSIDGTLDDLASRTPRLLGVSMTYDHASDTLGQSTRRSTRRQAVTPESVLENIEVSAIKHYNNGRTIQPDGYELARPPLELRPLRDTPEALDDLIMASEALGGTLWASWQRYSEDFHGIEFSISLPNRQSIKLNCDTNVRLAIENSWIQLHQILKG